MHVAQFFARSSRGVLAILALGLSWLVLLGRRSLARVNLQPGSLVENPLTALASEPGQDLSPSLPFLSTRCTVGHLSWNEVKPRQFCLDLRFEPSCLV